MNRTDAYARLVEHFDSMCLAANDNERAARAKHRRLIRALLVERANAAMWAANNVRYARDGMDRPSYLALEAAVLRRPAKGGKR